MVIAVLGVPVWHHLVGLFLLLANMHGNIAVLLLDQALGFLRHRFDFIVEKKKESDEMVPDRYSKDSDDHLMNMLISKGYAFSKEPGAGINIIVDCGCNCNCCFG
jgi:hypothetical protein